MYKRLLQDFGFAAAFCALIGLVLYEPWTNISHAVVTHSTTAVFLDGPVQPVDPIPIPPCQDGPYYIEASPETVSLGIDGWELCWLTSTKLKITVDSQHRSADIILDGAPPEGQAKVTVNVHDSNESLVFVSHGWHGTVSINGRPVASWQHVEGDEWEFVEFDQLSSFTSWLILSHSLLDEQFYAALFWVIVKIIVVVVAVLTLGVAVKTCQVACQQLAISKAAACAQHFKDCEDSGFDENNFGCDQVLNECNCEPGVAFWCGNLFNQCWDEDDVESCELWNQYCWCVY